MHLPFIPMAAAGNSAVRLLKEMIAIFHSRAPAESSLRCADNHSAIKVYERAGFASGQALPNYYGHGISGIRMNLAISERA